MNLPILPVTGVGSFPKPEYVAEAKGLLDLNSRRAVEEFIHKQEAIGVDVLVDGEFYRGDMATDYARALELPIAGWTRSYDNRYWKKGIVDKALERRTPIQLEQFKYAQSLTRKPVKAMLSGPTTLANWNFDGYYGERRKLVHAWAQVIRREAQDLENAGAKYIQIDEPAVAERYWEEDLFRKGLEIVTRGLKKTTYTITHVCYGNYALVYRRFRHLPINQIDIELSNELDLGPKRSEILKLMKRQPLTKHKDVGVGVIDVRPGVPVETLDTVVSRIRTALSIFAPKKELLQRVWIKPDCGFRTTKDPRVAYEKMEVMMRAVEIIRRELGETSNA
jgi:5-methyltetrahydropteroyltriglutamate--homocysteine methyltransferase